MKNRYYKDDKVYDMICSDGRLLQVISRFSLPLGVADKTIGQVCKENNIDTDTFLAVVNFTKSEGNIDCSDYHIDLQTLCQYLKNTHSYLLDFYLPYIRKNLIDAVGFLPNNDITYLIIKFFDEYCLELKKHMEIENDKVFPYVGALLAGKHTKPISIEMSLMHKTPIEQKLSELKNIIIKYYNAKQSNHLLYNILASLLNCEEDLIMHCAIEEKLFIPLVKKLEDSTVNNKAKQTEDDQLQQELTEREKDIIIGVVKGLTNKEIADKLCISVNTVTTHRRNIAKKLNIHSPSGITIYAIVNNLVDIKDIKI